MNYKWGRFQGIVCLILGCSMLFAGGYISWKQSGADTLTAWMGGLLFSATGIGLIAKKRYGVVLVCVLFAMTLLLPLTGHKPKYSEGYLFHAVGLIFWGFPALFYYPKRWKDLS
jgi:hypothetical protein